MFRESENLAGAFHCTDEDQDAGRQSNQVNQKNKRTEIESESEETIDDQIEGEQDHSEFFHAPIFVLAASLCRDVSRHGTEPWLQRFQIFDQVAFLVVRQSCSVIVTGI
jgi:hypothetical protein